MKHALLCIDPQRSFSEDPQVNGKPATAEQRQELRTGELYVPGSDDAMKRLANFVDRMGKEIRTIQTTMDSHGTFHIAHPCMYKSVADGSPPDFFTRMEEKNGEIIGSVFNGNTGQFEEVGKYRAAKTQWQPIIVNYLKKLYSLKRYPHTIWPPHCRKGTDGWSVHRDLYAAFERWELATGRNVDYTTKGSNPFCEHFSGVQAEVIDPNDPSTQFNKPLVDILLKCDVILLSGLALSHCLANTVRDIHANYGEEFVRKCVLLKDATGNVPGFEHYGDLFVADMTAIGMRVSTTVDYLAV